LEGKRLLCETPVERSEAGLDETIVDSPARPVVATRAFDARDRQTARATLKAQAPDYEKVLDNLSLGVCLFDGQQRLILCNQRWAEMYGLTPAQVRPGATLREIVEARVGAGTFPTDTEAYLSLCARISSGDETKNWTIGLKDGRAIHVCNRPMPGGGWVATHEDITARGAEGATAKLFAPAQAAHAREAQILEMIALSAPVEQALNHVVHLVESQVAETFGAILLVDDDGSRLRHAAAPSLTQAHRIVFDGVAIGPKAASYGAAIERRAWVFVANMMDDPLWQDCRQSLDEHGFSSCWAIPIVSRRGAALGVLALHSRFARELTKSESDLIDRATRIAGLAIERKQADDRMHFMANHDPLTGLANRALLNDRLTQAALHARRHDRWLTVAVIDLDDFKSVNDTLGHDAGDQLLKIVADRIVHCVRGTDTAARVGGDEFVVLLIDQPKNPDAISAVLDKIRTAIAQPVRLNGRKLNVTGSMGAAKYPDDGTDAASLLAIADAAMYEAKKIGGDSFRFRARDAEAGNQKSFAMRNELLNGEAALRGRRRKERRRRALRLPIGS
jgi:diguanylate cyclase (GGDEF)-like protein